MVRLQRVLNHARDALERRLGSSVADCIWKCALTILMYAVVPYGCASAGTSGGVRFESLLVLWKTASLIMCLLLTCWFIWQARTDAKQQNGTSKAGKSRETEWVWCLRLVRQSMAPATCGIFLMVLTVGSAMYIKNPQVSVTLFPKSGFDTAGVYIVAVQNNQTVARETANGNGHGQIRWLNRENTKFYAIRLKDDFIEWSEFQTEGSQSDLEFLRFPEFRHAIDEHKPVLFPPGSSELTRAAGEVILDISQELSGTEELILLLCRTSKTPTEDPARYDNYGLSLDRGETTRNKFTPAIPLPQMIVLPLDYQVPVKDGSGANLDNEQQRSVTITRLRRVFKMESGKDKPVQPANQRGMVYTPPPHPSNEALEPCHE